MKLPIYTEMKNEEIINKWQQQVQKPLVHAFPFKHDVCGINHQDDDDGKGKTFYYAMINT